jgi:hypothetical protein
MDANAEVNFGLYQDRGVSGLPQAQGFGVIAGLNLSNGETPLPGTEIQR